MFSLTQREDDALVKSIRALRVQQTGLPQQIEGITLCREMPAQTSAGGIADLQFLDQRRIVHSALTEITPRLGAMIELLLIESRGLYKHSRGVRLSDSRRIQISQALAEGQMVG